MSSMTTTSSSPVFTFAPSGRTQVIPRLPGDICYEIFLCLAQEQDHEIRSTSSGRNSVGRIEELSRTLRALFLVSRQFYMIIVPLFYRTLCLLSGRDVGRAYNLIRKHPDLCGHVRTLLFVEPVYWVGNTPAPLATPDLMNIVEEREYKKRQKQNMKLLTKLETDASHQMVSILGWLENLKYLKYVSHRRGEDCYFQWNFMTRFHWLFCQKTSRSILGNLEEVDLTSLHCSKRVPFLHFCLCLPKIRSFSLSDFGRPLDRGLRVPLNTSRIRELRISNTVDLKNIPVLVRFPRNLEILHVQLCQRPLLQRHAQAHIERALRSVVNSLKELYISATAGCFPIAPERSSTKTWNVSLCNNLHTLEIPDILYIHNQRRFSISGNGALHLLLPSQTHTLILSTWSFDNLNWKTVSKIAYEGTAFPSLKKIVVQSMGGKAGYTTAADPMRTYAAAATICSSVGMAFECRHASGSVQNATVDDCAACFQSWVRHRQLSGRGMSLGQPT